MNKNDYTIRLEKKRSAARRGGTRARVLLERVPPGLPEALRPEPDAGHPDFIPELSFVLEKDGALIGQNVFVRAAIRADDGRTNPIAAMGPICIADAYKRQNRGKLLLDFTLERARAYGIKAVCFEGNIDFCGKSGFDYASRFGIRYPGLPEGADASFFLCRELEAGYLDGVTGEYAPSSCCFVDKAFDRLFPVKEKKVLPTQLF